MAAENRATAVWGSDYQEAIYTLAWWRFEAFNSELSEPRRFSKYNDRYVGGFEMLKTLTGKSYAEINCDIVDAYNTRYNK